MATSLFDSVDLSGLNPAETLLHTAATPGVVMSIRVANTYKSTLPLSIWMMRDGQKISIADQFRVKSGDSVEVLVGSKVAIHLGDKIYGSTPIGGTFSGVLSIYKDE